MRYVRFTFSFSLYCLAWLWGAHSQALAAQTALPAAPETHVSVWQSISDAIDRKSFTEASALLSRAKHAPMTAEEALTADTLEVKLLIASGRAPQAEALLTQLITRDPLLAERHLFELAKLRVARGDFQGALSATEEIDPEGLYAEGAALVRLRAWLGLGQHRLALQQCDKTLSPMATVLPERLLLCAQAYIKAPGNKEGQGARAISYLRTLLRHFAVSDKTRETLSEAAALLTRIKPDYGETLKAVDDAYIEADALYKKREYTAAREPLQRAISLAHEAGDKEAESEARTRLAQIQEYKLEYEEALKGYLQASQVALSSGAGLQASAFASRLALRMKRYGLAKSMGQKLVESAKTQVTPSDKPSAELREGLFTVGLSAFLSHDFAEATRALSRLEALAIGVTERSKARYFHARALEGQLEHEPARQLYLQILKEDPAGYYALRGEGRLQLLGPGRLEKSATSRAAPEAIPSDDEALALAKSPIRSFGHNIAKALKLAARFFKTEATRLLQKLARGRIPSHADALALKTAFITVGDQMRGEIVLMNWQYEHFNQLSRADQIETLRMRHPRFFEEAVVKSAAQAKVDVNDVFAVIRQESRFLPLAVSPVSARGLMQLMYPTAQQVARKHKIPLKSTHALFEPEINLRLGTLYLAQMLEKFGQRELAFAAYNGGPRNVGNWIKLFGDQPPDIFCELIPLSETKDYVKLVSAYARGYRLLTTPEWQNFKE